MPESGGKPDVFTSGWAKLKSSLFEMDSLDGVEVLIALEEVFEVEITDAEAEAMTTPRHVIDWLVPRVSEKDPNEKAMRILDEQYVSAWDRARVSAVVRAIIVEQTGTKVFNDNSTFRNDIFS